MPATLWRRECNLAAMNLLELRGHLAWYREGT